jgi:hypothetical protein
MRVRRVCGRCGAAMPRKAWESYRPEFPPRFRRCDACAATPDPEADEIALYEGPAECDACTQDDCPGPVNCALFLDPADPGDADGDHASALESAYGPEE